MFLFGNTKELDTYSLMYHTGVSVIQQELILQVAYQTNFHGFLLLTGISQPSTVFET